LLILIYFAIKNTELTTTYYYHIFYNLRGCQFGTLEHLREDKITSMDIVREMEKKMSEEMDGRVLIVNFTYLKKTYKINWK